MQISIHIDATSAEEAQQAMLGLLAGTGATLASTTPAETTSGAKRGGRKASSDSKSAEGDAGNAAGGAGASSVSDAEASQPANSGPVTKESLGPRLLQLGQKAGPSAASELLGEFGAKKLSEVPEDKYVAMNARLDDLLAGPES